MADEFQHSRTDQEALSRAAALVGVETEFWDIWGNHHVTEPEAQRTILKALGISAVNRDQIDHALEERAWQEWSRLLPVTSVLSAAGGTLQLSLPSESAMGQLHLEFYWEDGSRQNASVPLADLPGAGSAVLRGHRYVRKEVPLPAGAPLGYHQVEASIDHQRAAGHLILAPDRAYQPEDLAADGKRAGIAVSLYGVRSARNWGCGDCTDLSTVVEWVAREVGGDFVALNPLHAIPNRSPYNTSPYLPTSSLYRNYLYLDVEALPEFAQAGWARKLLATPGVQQELEALRQAPYVEYERVSRIKLVFLKLCFRELLRRRDSPRWTEFQHFVQSEGRPLALYATHAALEEVIHTQHPDVWNWRSWPAAYQDPDTPETQAFVNSHDRLVAFYQFLQFALDQQFAAAQARAKAAGMEIGLYHDLALATDLYGGDLWAYRHFYVPGCRVGAPPDNFSPKGQDWSFPPPDSAAHFADGYQLFAASLRKNLRHGGALRIDHVMRFFRLYWIPEGLDATQGTYVRDRQEELLRVLALESVRQKVMIIGEDLGTVAPSVREALARFGILSYRLLYFEKNPEGGFKLPSEYPLQALVSASTHDLPTLAGFWTNQDIEARHQAGLLPDEASYRRMLDERLQEKQKLMDVLQRLRLLPGWFPREARQVKEFTGELHNAVMGFLASTPSMLLVVNQEDLTKDPEQQNLPGSTEQYPNWRHKMRFTLEELMSAQEPRDYTGMVRGWLERTGRVLPAAQIR